MLLRATGISKSYGGRPALREVSLEVDGGEVVGLVGENGAGKSTLAGILAGALAPDAGRIEIDGRVARFRSPRDASDAGIALVHQHDTLVPRFTVAENLGLAAALPWFPRGSELAAHARQLSARYGLDPGDPSAPCERLSVGARQRVEILKALARPRRLLLLDEPTATLAPAEIDECLRVIERLRAAGVAIVLVSHKLHEVARVCSRVVVLRRGDRAAELRGADATPERLGAAMVGRPIEAPRRPKPARSGAPLLAVRGLTTRPGARRVALAGIEFAVGPGEILGVAGVDGNGQAELVEALLGLERPLAGSVSARGAVAAIVSDRQTQGLLLDASVAENLMLDATILRRAARRGVLAPAALRANAVEAIERFAIRATGPDAPARSLSGGNQQKVVVARALARDPAVLVAAQPTRGLDIDATAGVHRELLAFAERGGSVVLVSTDLDEISALAHRAIVLAGGHATHPFDLPFTPESYAAVGLAMAGGARR